LLIIIFKCFKSMMQFEHVVWLGPPITQHYYHKNMEGKYHHMLIKTFISKFSKIEDCTIAKSIKMQQRLRSQHVSCLQWLIKSHAFLFIQNCQMPFIFHISIPIIIFNDHGVCVCKLFKMSVVKGTRRYTRTYHHLLEWLLFTKIKN